ncbi:MAG: hypothetical protein ABI949_13300 [Ilumatobacteraceae bacterium]
MAPSNHDEPAKRSADRLQPAPPVRGATVDDTPLVPPRRATSTHPSQGRVRSLGRGAVGGRLRGHLVPHSLHADARRLKVAQQARRGQRVTWDDVAVEAVELLLAQRSDLARRLSDVRRLADQATVGPRLIQATIPVELDLALSELRLDLADEFGYDVPYEQLWAAAFLIWLRAHR